MEKTNVAFRDVVTATIHADNSADTERTADISADAVVQGGRVTNLQNGVCTDIADPSRQTQFSWGDNYLSCTHYGYPDTDAILAATRMVSDFVSAASALVPAIASTGE